MDFTVVQTTLSGIAKFLNGIRTNVTGYYNTHSLPEATKLTRVEPLTILSKDCLNLEYMPDITNSVLNIFCGYYLQAVAMLTKVNDVEVIRILDKLNPDRDSSGFLLGDTRDSGKANNGFESFNNIVLENYKYSLPTSSVLALENKVDNDLQTVANLSIGKMLNVNISYTKDDDGKDKSVNIPVSVRLLSSVLPNSTINHLLTSKNQDNSIVERFHAWRGGRIDFIKDLIFCQDLIDEYKRANLTDDSNTMQEILRRVNNSKKFGLLTKNPSLVSASNIFIFSEEVAREVEAKLGGKLSNAKIRQKAFDSTYAMLLVVVDREWERVIIYTRGTAAATDLSIKEIKSASKNGKGPDIMDLLKSFQVGQAPMF